MFEHTAHIRDIDFRSLFIHLYCQPDTSIALFYYYCPDYGFLHRLVDPVETS